MLNTNEAIENAGFKWVDGLYIKITGTIETLIEEAGADRLIMSKGIYDALYEKYSGEMYIPATEENFKDYLIKNGGISQVRFIHFIYNKKWYAITDKEAVEHKIKEDAFNYDAFALGRFYNLNEIESEDFLLNAYDFEEHELWEKDQKQTRHNQKIDKLLKIENVKGHKFNSHSQATKFMINYYVNMCGYKLFDPRIDGGVFAVASKEEDTILTLHDDKTIKKSTGHKRDNGVLTEDEYKVAHNDYADIAGVASQGE